MTESSSWSEDAPGADILDLDRYMRGSRPARRPHRNTKNTGLVVDGGAAGRLVDEPGDSSSGSEASGASGPSGPTGPSGPSGPSDKRFSHDSGLSDTSYKRDNRQRRHRTDPIKNVDEPRRGTKSVAESRRGKSHATRRGESETRRGKSRETRRSKTREAQRSDSSGTRRGKSREARRSDSGEARRGKSREAGRVDSGESRRGKSGARRGKIREARRGKSGSVRRSSGSRSSFRDTLERALRDQQAQIARVAQMCELQARSGVPVSERRSERHSEHSERRRRPSERRGDKRNERSEREDSGRTSSETTEFSSSSSSVDAVKRRTSECRTYKIIMSKLDELNRLFVARRAAGAPGAPAPKPPGALVPKLPAARAHDDSSVTVSDKVVGTESPKHTARKAEFEHNRTIIVAAAAVDIPPAQRLNCNVVTESVVRDERESGPASEKGMPGHFHLDDPVRVSGSLLPLPVPAPAPHWPQSSARWRAGGPRAAVRKSSARIYFRVIPASEAPRSPRDAQLELRLPRLGPLEPRVEPLGQRLEPLGQRLEISVALRAMPMLLAGRSSLRRAAQSGAGVKLKPAIY